MVKVSRDDVVNLLASDDATIQFAMERVGEIVEGSIFLVRHHTIASSAFETPTATAHLSLSHSLSAGA